MQEKRHNSKMSYWPRKMSEEGVCQLAKRVHPGSCTRTRPNIYVFFSKCKSCIFPEASAHTKFGFGLLTLKQWFPNGFASRPNIRIAEKSPKCNLKSIFNAILIEVAIIWQRKIGNNYILPIFFIKNINKILRPSNGPNPLNSAANSIKECHLNYWITFYLGLVI